MAHIVRLYTHTAGHEVKGRGKSESTSSNQMRTTATPPASENDSQVPPPGAQATLLRLERFCATGSIWDSSGNAGPADGNIVVPGTSRC
jgi:hypothetical protein